VKIDRSESTLMRCHGDVCHCESTLMRCHGDVCHCDDDDVK